VARVLEASLLVDARAALGEAPQWDAREESLVWVDILAGVVFLTSASGESRASYGIGHAVGSAMPAEEGGWLLADAIGFSRLSHDGRTTMLLDVLADRPELRFNDAKCDPRGRAWAGTISADMSAGTGTLYRLDPGPVATPVLHGLTVSNGLGWSPDGRTMWLADSADRFIRAFEYEVGSGRLGAGGPPVELQQTAGKADALCVDDAGCRWVGLWAGGAVHRYTPDGRLDTIVRVPAGQVTSCAFGGSDGSTLYITTARVGLTAEALGREPLAGGLFVVGSGVTGPAATPGRLEPDRARSAGCSGGHPTGRKGRRDVSDR
jgi:sugar lactone lactonase YvrE